jgi:hemerythrin-like metal-binding protein
MKSAYGHTTAVPELDRQHRQLFERFLFVKETMARGGGWNDQHAALQTLIRRFEFCTSLEEALMQIQHYPECEGHRDEHADLLRIMRAMERATLTSGLTEGMIGTAFAATMKHHLTQDRRYARTLPQAGSPSGMQVSG